MTVERLRANRRRARQGLRIPPRVLTAVFVALGAGLGLVASRTLELPRLPLPSATSWLRAERFSLHHVDWVGLHALRAEDLVRALDLREGTALVDVDPEALAAKLAPHPRIERVRALRIPPDRLLVAVDERVPLGVLAGSGDGFDAGGKRFPLAPGEADGLPRVSGDSVAAAAVLDAARDRGLAVDAVEAGKSGVRFRPVGREVLVRVGADAGSGLDAWLRVAASGLDRTHRASEVDVRFRGSAVLRAPAGEEPNRGGHEQE